MDYKEEFIKIRDWIRDRREFLIEDLESIPKDGKDRPWLLWFKGQRTMCSLILDKMNGVLEKESDIEFRPNWASPPGDTILDLLDDKNITPSKLATYLQISSRETRDLLDGTFKITDEIAEKLAEFLGGSKQFWLNRDLQYRETLERLKK